MKPEPEANNPQRESALPSATLLGQRVCVVSKSAWQGEIGDVIRIVPENMAHVVYLESGLSVAFFENELKRWPNDSSSPTAGGGSGGAQNKGTNMGEASNADAERLLRCSAVLAAEEAEKSAWWQLEKLTEQAQSAHKRMEDGRNKWALAYSTLKSAQRKAANYKLTDGGRNTQ